MCLVVVLEGNMDGLRVGIFAGACLAVLHLTVRLQQRFDIVELGVLRYTTDDDFGRCTARGKRHGNNTSK